MLSGRNIGSTTYSSSVAVTLKKDFFYKIFIHDANYFLVTRNPRAMPGASLDIISEEAFDYASMFLSIEIILHSRKNLQSRPCETNTLYDLSTCISLAAERQVGCRLPWNQVWRPC